MFNQETYIRRRSELKRLVGNGIVILFGNNEAPANYPANSFAPMRRVGKECRSRWSPYH